MFMKSLTINIKNKAVQDKVIWFLEHLKTDGVEIIAEEDLIDLKLLAATREERSVALSDYLKSEG